MVVKSIGTIAYLTVAIEIGIHHITSLPACAEAVLTGTGTSGSLTVLSCVSSVKSVEVSIHLFVGLGDTNRGVTPNLSEFSSIVIAA